MTTITEAVTALVEARDIQANALQRLEAERSTIEAFRQQLQQGAWDKGWENSINSSLDDLLREHGLKGRPERVAVEFAAQVSQPTEWPAGRDNLAYLGMDPRLAYTIQREVQVEVPEDHEGCACSMVTEQWFRDVTSSRWGYDFPEDLRVDSVTAVRCYHSEHVDQ